MVFVGERETVYDCTGQYDNGGQHSHCYVAVQGEAQDVTQQIADNVENGAEPFSCAQEMVTGRRLVRQGQQQIASGESELLAEKTTKLYLEADPGSLERRGVAAEIFLARHKIAPGNANLKRGRSMLAAAER
jgi:hypothetical protein